MDYPVTLLLLFVAAVFAVLTVFTAPYPQINGATFATFVFLFLALLAGWVEHQRAVGRRHH